MNEQVLTKQRREDKSLDKGKGQRMRAGRVTPCRSLEAGLESNFVLILRSPEYKSVRADTQIVTVL
jgi:hypothetical protein